MAVEIEAPHALPLWRLARPSRAARLEEVVHEHRAALDKTHLIWRAPGVWLAAGQGAQDVASRVAGHVGATLFELTGAMLFWRVSGNWIDVLAHGSPLDPADQVFNARGVAWTRFIHFEIGVLRSSDATACHVIGALSVAGDLDAALRRARHHAEELP